MGKGEASLAGRIINVEICVPNLSIETLDSSLSLSLSSSATGKRLNKVIRSLSFGANRIPETERLISIREGRIRALEFSYRRGGLVGGGGGGGGGEVEYSIHNAGKP